MGQRKRVAHCVSWSLSSDNSGKDFLSFFVLKKKRKNILSSSSPHTFFFGHQTENLSKKKKKTWRKLERCRLITDSRRLV